MVFKKTATDPFKKGILLWGILVFATWELITSGLAQGYVLPGPHLLELMTKKLGRFNTVMVQQQVTVYRDEDQQDALFLNEKLRYQAPGRYRSESASDHSQRILVVNGNQQVVVIDGELDPDGETRFDIYRDILLFRDRQAIEEQLAARGLDVLTSSLGRFQARIGYVIGVQYPDESVSQMWLDQTTFRPFRWVIDGGPQDENQFFEVLYSDWRQSGGIWYPHRIEFFLDGILVRNIKVLDVSRGLNFDPTLFDIQAIRQKYQRGRVDDTPQEVKPMDEVTEAINDFKKLYE
jgi:hypothetical protein